MAVRQYSRVTIQLSAACSLVLAVTLCATAARYNSADGYSFDYPDSWTVVADRKPIDSRTHYSCKLAESKVFGSNFAANMNIVIATREGVLPVLPDNLQRVERITRGSLQRDGMTISSFQSEIVKVAGFDAFSCKWAGRVTGMETPLSQWQLTLRTNDGSFCITFTSAQDDYPANAEIFKQIVASLTISPSGGMPGWLVGALAGGGVGAMAGLVLWLVVRARKKTVPVAVAEPDLVEAQAAEAESPIVMEPAPTVAQVAQAPDVAEPVLAQALEEYSHITCACGLRFRVPKRNSGKTGRCPKCQAPFVVP